MNVAKQAKPDHAIHELIADRWSPYGFSDRPVSAEDLRSLFEAARWAPSSYNEQPWTYLVATKENPGAVRAAALLPGGSQSSLGETSAGACVGMHKSAVYAERSAKPGRHPRLGARRGRHLFRGHGARIVRAPDGRHPSRSGPAGCTTFPRGSSRSPDWPSATPPIRKSFPTSCGRGDLSPRPRKPLAEFVFGGKWGTTLDLL